MPKIPECDRCLLYSRNPYLICAVHPTGPNTNTCIDFREDPNTASDELWEPEGASYYNGELILQPPQRWTLEQQLELWTLTHCLLVGVPGVNARSPSMKRRLFIGIVRLAGGWMIQFEDGSRRFCFDNGDRYLLSRASMHLTFWLRLNKLNKELWFFK